MVSKYCFICLNSFSFKPLPVLAFSFSTETTSSCNWASDFTTEDSSFAILLSIAFLKFVNSAVTPPYGEYCFVFSFSLRALSSSILSVLPIYSFNTLTSDAFNSLCFSKIWSIFFCIFALFAASNAASSSGGKFCAASSIFR